MKRQTQALASGRRMRQDVPQVRPEVSGVRANTRGGFAAKEIVLNTAPTTLKQRVTRSRARRGHGDGHLTIGPWTQTMHGNRVPFHRVAVGEFAREQTEEREQHSSARMQELHPGRAHFK
jgi:hypothetical protein